MEPEGPARIPRERLAAEAGAAPDAVERILAAGLVQPGPGGDSPVVSHLVDPRTGRALGQTLLSVSVLAKSAMEADAWATALCVLGPEDGWRVANEFGLAVHFVLRKDDGGFAVRATPRFAERIVTAP